MAELVSELIGKLGPGAGFDIDNNPRGHRIFCVQPDVRRPRGLIVDAEPIRLMVGKQP